MIAGVRAKRRRGPDTAGRGEISRFVLGVLREATEPMPTPAIAAQLMTERGVDQQNHSKARNVTKRVGMALRHKERRDTVRSQAGPGRVLLWEVAG